MSTQEEKATVTVAPSGMVAVISTYHGPTNNKGRMITVHRADGHGVGWGRTKWNYSLTIMENHALAIQEYLEMYNWGGRWAVGSTKTGAVAPWAGWE